MAMKVLIVCNSERREAKDAAYSLCPFLEAQGCTSSMITSNELYGIQQRAEVRASLKEMPDLTVVLGGDGTIIRTASVVRAASPILGINFGHLGFLANDSQEGVIELVERALCDELNASRRTCLEASFYDEDEGEACTSFVVNEVAITRGTSGTSLEFKFAVSDVTMADLKGDGLIVASATGSTGYAMAAGGPLVTPGFTGMVVQPLAPHTLLSRALLTDANDVVEVTMARAEDAESALFLIDGDVVPLDVPIRSVRVQRASEPVTFLYAKASHFLHYSAQKFFGV